MQRTFVGVDAFTVFQEIVLRGTEDPRVSNIVKFSEEIGELKVEVWYELVPLNDSLCTQTIQIADELGQWHVEFNCQRTQILS